MTIEEKKERKRLYDIEYQKKNAEKKKQQRQIWYKNNIDKKKLKDKKYYEENKEKKRLYDIEYRKKNSEKKKINDKKYYEENKDEIKKKTIIYQKKNKERINQNHINRKENDPLYKLSCSLRSSIKESFKRKGTQKTTKTELILGCSFEFFKTYIESKFEPWMNWDNYGNPKDGILELNKTWDIDHIIPLASANTIDEIIKLNHYTNLQPLCSKLNRHIKINKVTWNL